MGMYNEVFKKCPHCGGEGYMQIPQITLGFGGFRLDYPEDIAEELSISEIKKLREYIMDKRWFKCQNCKEDFELSDSKTAHDNEKKEKLDILNGL